MNEKELITLIKSTVNSEYIGDDCAYLKDLGIVVTQDSLVEGVHFSLDFITPYQLGFKSVAVNISDICASGAEPEYLTISLSLPNYVNENFVKNFYEGAKDAAQNAKIVGGDITGSDKIYISVCAIGNCTKRKISSRSNAKKGYTVIVSGEHGNSAQGLKLLLKGEKDRNKFTDAHLTPLPQLKFSKEIAENINCDYAMMDTSDGLADALIQIAKSSDVTISVKTSKIPHDPSVDLETVLYGGEDYQLVAVVPEEILSKISDYTIIGKVTNNGFKLIIDGKEINDIDKKIYNHFEEKK